MTKAEKKHLNRVAELGCIICGMPAEIHHKRKGVGMGRRQATMKLSRYAMYITVPEGMEWRFMRG